MTFTPAAKLILKRIWNNGSCTFEVLYPPSASFDRHQIGLCADIVGYLRHGNIWTPPNRRSAFSELSNSLSHMGVKVEIEHGPEDARFNLQRLKLETTTRTKLETLQNFELYHLSGWTPVQAEGSINGRYWYFRARGSHWRIEIGGNESGSRSARWWYEEEWPSVSGFEAGYLSDEDAIACILKAVHEFRTGDQGKFCPGHPQYERTVLEGWAMGALLLQTVCIRLQISGQTAIDNAQAYSIEPPYTAEQELKLLKSGKMTIHRLHLRTGRWHEVVLENGADDGEGLPVNQDPSNLDASDS